MRVRVRVTVFPFFGNSTVLLRKLKVSLVYLLLLQADFAWPGLRVPLRALVRGRVRVRLRVRVRVRVSVSVRMKVRVRVRR